MDMVTYEYYCDLVDDLLQYVTPRYPFGGIDWETMEAHGRHITQMCSNPKRGEVYLEAVRHVLPENEALLNALLKAWELPDAECIREGEYSDEDYRRIKDFVFTWPEAGPLLDFPSESEDIEHTEDAEEDMQWTPSP